MATVGGTYVMEEPKRTNTQASASSRSFVSRSLMFGKRDGSNETSSESKGPFGLNSLYIPQRPALADLIFVHGLGGGSRSTWTKSGDPSLYWPQAWLPEDPGFQDVRIHSFGYDSNWEKESILNLHDFAKSLLGSIHDCPTMTQNPNVPLIFCGHSMGGLLIKRAYILAKQKNEFQPIADRTRGILFLATPHRGADLAQTFSKILNVTSGPRPFVEDLHRNSLATQSINDEFPNYCHDLQLYSFYETVPTKMGMNKAFVVDKDLAILGYANERTAYLNANHREVCKYNAQTDPNYQTVRNALASIIDDFRTSAIVSTRELNHEQRRLIDNFLGVSDALEDDYMDVDALRMKGSCEWLLEKSTFKEWLESANTKLYWITAKPATGKTILTGKVVHHLRGSQRDTAFYFFDYRNKAKTSISSFLLSVAWQMALIHANIFDAMLEIRDKEEHIFKADHRTIWRKLFVECILRFKFVRPQYWIIDGLDECKANAELVPLLLKAVESGSIRTFVTSRDSFEAQRQPIYPKGRVISDEIQVNETKADIMLFLEEHMHILPATDAEARHEIASKILVKSSGCFLWVRLIFEELRGVHTSAETRQVLEDIPSDMNELYARILENMSRASYGKKLAKTILTWTTCSARSLSTHELYRALQLEMKDQINNIERAIGSSCGQLIYVDSQSRVQMVHQTARDFLLRFAGTSEFAIDGKEGHKNLLMTCLQYLCGNELKGPRHRRLSATNVVKQRSPFAAYACTSFYEHIIQVHSTDNDVLSVLARFLNSSNALSWIEYIAENSNLNQLIQAGKAFRGFLQRRSKSFSPFGKEVALLDSWAVDLVRLVTKFGKHLKASPTSIFHLIPPFCPPDSALHRNFASNTRGIALVGLSATAWGDCLSTIGHGQSSLTALACSDKYFGVGMSNGNIIIYNDVTCQETRILHHTEPVKIIQFARRTDLLASTGFKLVRLWDTSSWTQLWEFNVGQLCLSITFMEDEQLLLGATRNNMLMIWELESGDLRDSADWTKNFEVSNRNAFRHPIVADFSVEQGFLAIAYRGHDIILWDMERDALHETYCKDYGACSRDQTSRNMLGVTAVLFSQAPAGMLLVASYSDGDLVLFDTDEGTVIATTLANAQTIACSPDGRTLAGSNSSGTIQLFDLENLKLLYTIKLEEYGIQALAFSEDSHRLLDIRGSECRVWDPPVLVREDAEEPNSDTVSVSTMPGETSVESTDVILITAMACHDTEDMFFCGKEDGSIYVYETQHGRQSHKLCSHADGVSILSLSFDAKSNSICSTDTASRVMLHQLVQKDQKLEVGKVVLDTREGVTVDQVLINGDCSRLLICTALMQTLWSINSDESACVNSIAWENCGSYKWTSHPSNPNDLIMMTNTTAHVYDWQTLQRRTSAQGILLEGCDLPELAIRSITTCFDGAVFATAFSEHSNLQSGSKLLLWSTSDFSPESHSAAPVPRYQALANEMRFLIGSDGHRVVFLQNDGWICSASMDKPEIDDISRHFFFPADWLSNNADLVCSVTRAGDVLFVKRDEVAVVKRGLQNMEPRSKDLPGKRPSLRGKQKASLSVPVVDPN